MNAVLKSSCAICSRPTGHHCPRKLGWSASGSEGDRERSLHSRGAGDRRRRSHCRILCSFTLLEKALRSWKKGPRRWNAKHVCSRLLFLFLFTTSCIQYSVRSHQLYQIFSESFKAGAGKHFLRMATLKILLLTGTAYIAYIALKIALKAFYIN